MRHVEFRHIFMCGYALKLVCGLRALLIEAAESPFFKSPFELGLLLQRPVFPLIENGFCADRTPNLQAGSETRRVWERSFLQGAMERYAQDARRQHTTYILRPRKTRSDTHHSRALDSPRDLANTHTAIFV